MLQFKFALSIALLFPGSQTIVAQSATASLSGIVTAAQFITKDVRETDWVFRYQTLVNRTSNHLAGY